MIKKESSFGAKVLTNSFKIGAIYGIDIEINSTWLIVFFLVTFSLVSYFPAAYPELPTWVGVTDGLITSILFFLSVLFHELSHSIVAKRNNLDIKRITLFVFGGVAQMSDEPSSPGVEFKMAVAGPAASYFLALLFAGLFLLSSATGLGLGITAPFQYLALINFALGTFNLIPGFPLDGGRILRAGLWSYHRNLAKATQMAARCGQFFAFGLVFLGILLFFRGDFLGGIWLIFLGWFLNQAATSGYQQTFLRQALLGVKVEEIMSRNILLAPANLTLTQLVDDYFLRYKVGRFPIIENGQLLGIVTLHDVKEVPRERWETTFVQDVLRPLKEYDFISPEEDVMAAFKKLAQHELGQLLVFNEGKLVGIVTKSDILRLAKFKRELA
jgi:Zn-dependent protease/CBS domain-containing protein